MATKKTAILVIHGVGPHSAFETFDAFAQGFCSTYLHASESKDTRIYLEHRIKQRSDSGAKWLESYVSFPVPGKDQETIDFYEYFWDIYMVHKPSFRDAFGMLSSASKSAHEFYKEYGAKFQGVLVKGTDLGEFGRRAKFGLGEAEFRPAGYLKLLGPFFAFLALVSPYIPFLIGLLDKWSQTNIPILKQLFGGLAGLMKEPVPDFVGDLVRYLDLDPRSERFETRRQIMNGAVSELKALIRDNNYQEIIVAGHSLGSVIAYDALSRLIQEASCEKPRANDGPKNDELALTPDDVKKIKGLVTFGSPLDKIALFFRQRVRPGNKIQRGVLADLRGFRSLNMDQYSSPKTDKDAPKYKLEYAINDPIAREWDKSIRWLNFYHRQDMISGRLDLYNLKGQVLNHKIDATTGKDDGNIAIEDDFSKLAAHGCYWGAYQGTKKGTDQMQQAIIAEFFS